MKRCKKKGFDWAIDSGFDSFHIYIFLNFISFCWSEGETAENDATLPDCMAAVFSVYVCVCVCVCVKFKLTRWPLFIFQMKLLR